MRKKSWQKHKDFLDGVHPLREAVEAAVGRRMIQVGSENDPQNEWNNTRTQLISTFTLYQKEKK